MAQGLRIRKKIFGSARPASTGGGGSAGGADRQLQYNNAGALDGFGRVLGDNISLAVEGAVRTESQNSADYFSSQGPTEAYSPSAARAHICQEVNAGPNSATFLVTASLVAKEDGANKGGAIIMAAVFFKDAVGVITKIGADQTLMAAVSNLTGVISGSFGVTANSARFTSSTTVVNCDTCVDIKTVCCGSTI